ncbi:MAG: hypothetical protein ABWW66_07725 [Archaeoglobaceae archaeon]
MVSVADVAELAISYVALSLEAVANLLQLMVASATNETLAAQGKSLNFSNVWGVIYGLLVNSYWTSEIAEKVLNVTLNNETALNNTAAAINVLGSNATEFFGDPQGTKGLAYIYRNAYELLSSDLTLLERLASDVAQLISQGLRFLVELGKAIPETFK